MVNNEEDIRTANQKVDDAHNRLLSIEQAYERTKRFKATEEQELEKIGYFKADIEKTIATLTSQKETLSGEIRSREEEKTALNKDISDLKRKKDEFETAMIKTRNAQEKYEEALRLMNDSLVSRETSVFKRENQVDASEKVLNKKHELIRSFKENL